MVAKLEGGLPGLLFSSLIYNYQYKLTFEPGQGHEKLTGKKRDFSQVFLCKTQLIRPSSPLIPVFIPFINNKSTVSFVDPLRFINFSIN